MESLAITAFMMGLMGGVHCVVMCGGIVGAVSLQGGGGRPILQLSYNAGRIASYALGGLLVGAFGTLGSYASGVLPVQMLLFVMANAFVILLGLYIAGWGRLMLRLESAGSTVWRYIRPLGSRFLPADTPYRALRLGLVWGWIPCGMVYSALAIALVSGGSLGGGIIMLAFGIGTLPNLVLAGLAAEKIRRAMQRPWVRRGAGSVMVFLGLTGMARISGLPDAIRNGIMCLS